MGACNMMGAPYTASGCGRRVFLWILMEETRSGDLQEGVVPGESKMSVSNLRNAYGSHCYIFKAPMACHM